nr:MAG TPA: hypothetical protein [Caudoviricetes sp.]
MDVWIETLSCKREVSLERSHPSRVRGLKLYIIKKKGITPKKALKRGLFWYNEIVLHSVLHNSLKYEIYAPYLKYLYSNMEYLNQKKPHSYGEK